MKNYPIITLLTVFAFAQHSVFCMNPTTSAPKGEQAAVGSEEKAGEAATPVALATQANKNSAAPEQDFQQPAQPFKLDLDFYRNLEEWVYPEGLSVGLMPDHRLRELALLRAWQHGLPNWKAEKSNL
jgi:hypothetical protein